MSNDGVAERAATSSRGLEVARQTRVALTGTAAPRGRRSPDAKTAVAPTRCVVAGCGSDGRTLAVRASPV